MVEFVRVVESDKTENDEELRLYRRDPVEVQLGDTLGQPVYTEAEYFVVINVDFEETVSEEEAQAMTAFGMETEAGTTVYDFAVVAVSNEDGEIGAPVEQLDDGTSFAEAEEYIDNL